MCSNTAAKAAGTSPYICTEQAGFCFDTVKVLTTLLCKLTVDKQVSSVVTATVGTDCSKCKQRVKAGSTGNKARPVFLAEDVIAHCN